MKAYLETYCGEWIFDYVYSSRNPLIRKGFEIKKFAFEDINDYYFSKNDILIGTVESTVVFFNSLNVKIPEPIGFYNWMSPYLQRNVSKTTLGEAIKIQNDIFIKPSDKVKLFTGYVIPKTMSEDKRNLFFGNIDHQTPVFISDALQPFTSEFRCFFEEGILVGCKPYTDNFKQYPTSKEFKIIEKAGKQLYNETDYKAFTMDWGYSNKQFVLIESNDMWAIGSYGLNENIYTDLIVKRFKQILS